MKGDCQDTREMIQDFLDGETPMPVCVEEHLKTCPTCRSFKESLEGFSLKLRASLDKEIKTLGSPDFSCLPDKPFERKGYRRSLSWIAALFLFAVLTLFSYRGYMSYRTHSFLREENRLFVERFFNRSIFEGEDSLEDIALFTGWFEETEAVSELMGDFSLIDDID